MKMALSLLICLVATAALAEGPTKVLFIGTKPDHPHGSHMYAHTAGVLAKCVKQAGTLETVISEGWPEDQAAVENVSTIMVYSSPGAELLLDGEHRTKVDELMQSGVGLVTIHWSSTVRKDNFARLGDRWQSYLGGTWISNVGLSIDKMPLVQLAPDHPVCRGWKEYELHDEIYLNPIIGEKTTPVLEVFTKGRHVVVGWAYERAGGGRSYATTLGHFYRNFENESFRRAIVNGILWTAHRDVPEGGALVELSPDDLKLPPEVKKEWQ